MLETRWILTIATAVGALGMWWLLPSREPRGRVAGAALLAIALGFGASQVPPIGNWAEQGIFFVLATVTIVAAIATVTMTNPVYCAIWFALSLLGTAGLFLYTGAQFLAAATIVVYAGAILVTFLFVLMLADPGGRAACDRTSWESLVSATTGVVLIGVLSITVAKVLDGTGGDEMITTLEPAKNAVLAEQHVLAIGAELFGRHLLAIEVAGVLLTAALIGAAAIVAQSGHRLKKNDQ